MQKVFIICSELDPDVDSIGNFEIVNEFMDNSGSIISVHPGHMGGESESRGRWLVVADDGKGDHDGLLP